MEAHDEEMKGRIGCLTDKLVDGQKEFSIKLLKQLAEKNSKPQRGADRGLPDALL